MEKTIEITSVPSLLEVLSKQENPITWYRGHKIFSWSLLPGLYRHVPRPMEEQEMIKRFRQSSLLLLDKAPNTFFDWMFWMQHYGVPTRLLDWTESPLCALYFAVEDDSSWNEDGALWMLNPIALNENQNIRAETSTFIPSFDDELLANYDPETMAKENKTALNPIASIATRNNPRIQAQLGVFTISHRKKDAVENIGNGQHVSKFKIPFKAKNGIFRELASLRIDRFSMFPELASIGYNIRKELGL